MSRQLYEAAVSTLDLERRIHHLEERVARLEAALDQAATPAVPPPAETAGS